MLALVFILVIKSSFLIKTVIYGICGVFLVSTTEPAGENPQLFWAWGEHSDKTTPALLKGLSTNVKVIPQHYSLSLTLQQTPSPLHLFERKNSSRDQAHLSSNLFQNLRTFTNLSNTSFIDTTPRGAWGQQGPYVNSSAYLVSLPASVVYTNNDSISIPQRNYQNALMDPSSFSLASSVGNFQQSDVKNRVVAAVDFQSSLEEGDLKTSSLPQQSKMKTGILSDPGQISFRSSGENMSYELQGTTLGSLAFEAKYFNPVDFKKSQKKSAVPILLKIRPRLRSSKGIRDRKTFAYADLYPVSTVGFSKYDSSLIPRSFMLNPLLSQEKIPSTDKERSLGLLNSSWILINQKQTTEKAQEATDFIFFEDFSSDREAEDERSILSFSSMPDGMSPTYHFPEDELSSDKKDEDEISEISFDFLDHNPNYDDGASSKATTPTPILPRALPSSDPEAEDELSVLSFSSMPDGMNRSYHFSDDGGSKASTPTPILPKALPSSDPEANDDQTPTLSENNSQLLHSEHIPYASRTHFTESLPQHLEDLEETVVTWVKESVESIKNFMISYLEKEQLTEEDFNGKRVRYHQHFQKTLAALLEHTYGIIYTFFPAFEEDVLADTLSFKSPPLSSSNLSSENLGSLQETPLSLETAFHLWKEDLKGYIDSFHSDKKYISSLISQKEQEVLSPLPFFYYIYKGIKSSYQEGDNEIEFPYDMYLRASFLVHKIDFKGREVFNELDTLSSYPKLAPPLDKSTDDVASEMEQSLQQPKLMASLGEDEASDHSGRSSPSSLATSIDLGDSNHSTIIQEDFLAHRPTENDSNGSRTILRGPLPQPNRQDIYPYGIEVDGFALLGQVHTSGDEDWEKAYELDVPTKVVPSNSFEEISESQQNNKRQPRQGAHKDISRLSLANGRREIDSKSRSSVGKHPILDILEAASTFFTSSKSPDTSRQGIIIKGSYQSLSEAGCPQGSPTRAPNPILRGSYKNLAGAEDYEMDFLS